MNALLLWRGLKQHGHFAADARLKRTLPMIVLASLVMGVALYAAARWLDPWLAVSASVVARFSALAVLVGAGGLVYFLMAQLTGAVRLGQLGAAFRRK